MGILAVTRQLHVAEKPRRKILFDAWSQSAGAETHYDFEIFDVDMDTLTTEAIQLNPANIWLTEAEIRAGQSADGRAVSPTVLRMLSALGAIC